MGYRCNLGLIKIGNDNNVLGSLLGQTNSPDKNIINRNINNKEVSINISKNHNNDKNTDKKSSLHYDIASGMSFITSIGMIDEYLSISRFIGIAKEEARNLIYTNSFDKNVSFHDIVEAFRGVSSYAPSQFEDKIGLWESMEYVMANAHSAFQHVDFCRSFVDLATISAVTVSAAVISGWQFHKGNKAAAKEHAPAP